MSGKDERTGETEQTDRDRTILSITDHTLLRPDMTREELIKLCDEGLFYRTASVCIPPSFVAAAVEYLAGRLPVCTVIGFPNGYSTTGTKIFEIADAIRNGADELDVVIPIGALREGREDEIRDELRALREASSGKIFKVIIETCLLDEAEKIRMCGIVTEVGADFIKTSTGFSKSGATVADVRLLRAHVGSAVKVKAAGGISSLADAEAMMEAGAERLGTSRIVKLIAGKTGGGYQEMITGETSAGY